VVVSIRLAKDAYVVQALTLPVETADSDLDPPLGFNFSKHGFTHKQERIERTKWRQALEFWNLTKSLPNPPTADGWIQLGPGKLDLSYDGYFFQSDIAAALSIVNYTKPDYLRMDIESFEDTLQDYVDFGYHSANFAPRKLPGESDGAASVRMAQGWVAQLVKMAKEIAPGLVPDVYDISALDGAGFQINTWSSMAATGAPASPCDYYRLNLLDRLAATVRNERMAILASGLPKAGLRPTLSPGETPGVDGLALYLDSADVTPYSVLYNQLIQIYAAGATGFAYYTQTGMYDMGLWLAMRDVFELVIAHEDLILDGGPAPDGAVFNSSEHAVVNAMVGQDGSMLIAASSMPPGREVTACVRSASATKEWQLCDLASNTTIESTTVVSEVGVICWTNAKESGSLMLFGRNTACH
jgi:hypothetical protein